MSAPDRTVRHLRLRARDEAEVRSAARRLEDALRCASLPDNGGRLLLVRRLDLGRMPADISSQTLALLIERRVQECGYTWVHGATPGAAQANAVWFQDAAEALITLARQVVQRAPLATAWFWRSVLPTYSAALAPAQILEMIVAHAAAQPTGRVVLAELVAALARIVVPEVLVTLFTPASQRVLQLIARQLDLPARSEHGAAHDGTRSWHGPQSDSVRLSSSLQAIASWLPVLLAAAGWTEMSSVLVVPQHAERGTESASGRQAMDIESVSANHPAAPDIESPSTNVPDSSALEHSAIPGALAVSHARPSNRPPGWLDDAPPARHGENPAPPRELVNALHPMSGFGEMHSSRAAGLLFLLSLLGRLGFDEWSAALTPARAQLVAVGVLRKALRRLRVDGEDAVHAMLEAWPRETVACGPIDAPRAWSDPRIALQMPLEPDSDALAALWLAACRRSLRRAARIGLASLVLRPGAFAWSLTHLDAHFDLGDTDLRVRRNALDIDPGWLPWLGRVVSFHYHQGGLS